MTCAAASSIHVSSDGRGIKQKKKDRFLAGVSCALGEYYKNTNFAFTEDVSW